MKKLFILTLIILLTGCQNSSFYLENKYYRQNTITEIDSQELEKLIKEKESFGIFVYQPSCITSSTFANVLQEFINKNNISFYKISFSELQKTTIKNKVKYFPSFILFNHGNLVEFLDANSKDDTIYYESVTDFSNWIFKYIKRT